MVTHGSQGTFINLLAVMAHVLSRIVQMMLFQTNKQTKPLAFALLRETRFRRQHQILLQRIQSFQDLGPLLFGIHDSITDAEEINPAPPLRDSKLVCS